MHVVWNIIAEIMGMHILEQPTLQHWMYSTHMFNNLAQHKFKGLTFTLSKRTNQQMSIRCLNPCKQKSQS